MRVVSGLDKLESAEFKNVAATIGTFDGVHLGHKKIIEKLLEISGQNNLLSTLITFQPHPQMVSMLILKAKNMGDYWRLRIQFLVK